MISVDEALELIAQHARPLAPRLAPVDEALGAVLAESVTSDVDSPPHDKAMVDGYAVRAADVAEGRELRVIEEVTAGATPTKAIEAGLATRIMTGAPIPDGADAVVMLEDTTPIDDAKVRFRRASIEQGANIMRRGASMQRGDVVLQKGAVIRPIEVGVLSEVGRTHALVIPRPKVAIIPTGDELVDVRTKPDVGKIRNSNGPMLAAQVAAAGAKPKLLPIARDDREELRQRIDLGLLERVVVLSGGVSAGMRDLVPSVLAELGVREVFHKVRIKPGKPLWFGVGERSLVFGLPGNPVASLVCFHVFVRSAIAQLAGCCGAQPLKVEQLPLAVPFRHRGDRPTFHPARRQNVEGRPAVEPLAWQGSGDLRTLADADMLIHFPAGDHEYAAGNVVDASPIDG